MIGKGSHALLTTATFFLQAGVLVAWGAGAALAVALAASPPAIAPHLSPEGGLEFEVR